MVFAFLLLNIVSVKAGNEPVPAGARQAAMAYTGLNFSDVWAPFFNPACLASIPKIAFGVSFENKFMVKELASKALASAIPVKGGVFGVSVSHLGYSNYYELKTGIGFGKKFGKNFSAGIQIIYLNNYIATDYGHKGAFVFEGGLTVNVLEKLNVGARIFNPVNAKIPSAEGQKIPSMLSIGFNYFEGSKLNLTLEVEKYVDNKASVKSGIEVALLSDFFLRGGFSTNPNHISTGIGYKIKRLKLDLAFVQHNQLGLTPCISIIYSPGVL